MRNITSVLTNNGQEMFADISGKTITFTKAVVGQYKSQYPLEQATNVNGYLKDMTITGTKTEDNRFILYLTLNNRDVLNDTYIYQIGIFAKINNGNEKLVQIIEGGIGDFVPNQTELFEKQYETSIKFESSFADSTINIEYGDSATLLTSHNNDENAHPKLKSWVTQQINNLEVTWNKIKNKPTEFNPCSHTHDFSEIKNLPDITIEYATENDIDSLFRISGERQL